MNLTSIQHILPSFGVAPGHAEVNPLGNGLINHTYKITDHKNERSIVLQVVNTLVFPHPEDIQHNYHLIGNFLKETGSTLTIPEMVRTTDGKFGLYDEQKRYWRAFEFIENTYSPNIADSPDLAYTAAKCFGQLTSELNAFDITQLKEILPRFHDLGYRFEQFEDALHRGNLDRIEKSRDLILQLLNRKYIVAFFSQMLENPEGYRLRVMHHDTKVSNILFNREDGSVVCPVDMDTVMPGRFYSDLGDMIRTMACSADENDTNFSALHIRKDYYQAILKGYAEQMGNSLTDVENQHLHYSGLIMIYQQALRFLTDYLLEDVYYKTTYSEHNLDRARNQIQLLLSLEEFLRDQYSFPITIPPVQSTVTP